MLPCCVEFSSSIVQKKRYPKVPFLFQSSQTCVCNKLERVTNTSIEVFVCLTIDCCEAASCAERDSTVVGCT